MASVAFYDSHFHALTLSHPDFLAFVDSVRGRRLESLYAQATAPGYLMGTLFSKGASRMRNLLSVMENDVAGIFRLMEDDLRGLYGGPEEGQPLLAGSELRLGRLRFDKIVIVPLIMDFETQERSGLDSYYDRPPAKPVARQAQEILEGIKEYRLTRPQGIFEIRPFLGINTCNYDEFSLLSVLEASFSGYRRGAARASAAFQAMAGYEATGLATPPLAFAGVKLYPPLGFDPWPEAPAERAKVELLYEFCEARSIPLVTHCDDQGFRVIGLEAAWTRTSPARWRPVLAAYPGLLVDFAHFGAQYSHPIGRTKSLGQALAPPTEWRDEILGLMGDYEGVYADFSFNGTDPAYYEGLARLLEGLPAAMGDLVEDRIMFGTDFVVNLTKIRSYRDYFRLYAESPLSDEWKRRFCHDNPERFLTGA